MIGDIQIRNQVRAFLATRGEHETVPEGYILLALNEFFPERIEAGQMMAAIQWNEARGFIESRHNKRLDRMEWKLSERGRREEGL
jgi:hypothetical protein